MSPDGTSGSWMGQRLRGLAPCNSKAITSPCMDLTWSWQPRRASQAPGIPWRSPTFLLGLGFRTLKDPLNARPQKEPQAQHPQILSLLKRLPRCVLGYQGTLTVVLRILSARIPRESHGSLAWLDSEYGVPRMPFTAAVKRTPLISLGRSLDLRPLNLWESLTLLL